jgi:glycosyltransferase involved in cell wall biosynthesis
MTASQQEPRPASAPAPAAESAPAHPALVSVILAAKDAADTIDAQLEALAGQTYAGPWELVFVDDGSSDETLAIVGAWRERLPHVRALSVPRRVCSTSSRRRPARRERTVTRARNRAVEHSHGELLLFCDADDIVGEAWIERMVDGLRRYPAVGGRIERWRLNDQTAVAVRPPKGDQLLDGTFGFLLYPMGANCGMRRDAWSQLGGFVDSYDSSEDVELFWRAQLAGYELGYVHDAVVHYRLRTSLCGMAAQAYSFGRSHPRLYRDFSRFGMPRSSARAALRECAWLAAHVRSLARNRSGRAVWLSRLALRLGRIVGSAQNRVIYL